MQNTIGLWEDLITALTETLDLNRAFLRLSQHKRSVLVTADAKELEATTRQEELLILHLAKMEGLREKTVAGIVAAYGLESGSLTLAKVGELAPGNVAHRLSAIGTEFEKVSSELVPLNESNAELIQQALTFINYNVNLLARSTAGTTYAPQGQTGEGVGSRALFDHKV